MASKGRFAANLRKESVPKAEPAAPKAAEKKEEEPPKEAKKTSSNVFALFPQAQIQEFKEAFTMIDANRDGFIDTDDLAAMYQNLGREPSKKDLEEMLKEVPGQLNFTAFLTLFGEKLHGTDPEDAIRNAFAMFDKDGKGTIPEEYLKDLLTNVGDQFSAAELKQMWKEAPVSGGQFDYLKYTTLIKRGNQEE
jgi:Ca2+-binding EF-hand superfamily protein